MSELKTKELVEIFQNNYSHYIRINEKKEIIKSFSTAFEQPQKGDICIEESTTERHYNLPIVNDLGVFLNKYIDGKIVDKDNRDIMNDEKTILSKEYFDREELIKNELREFAIERLKEKGLLNKDGNMK